MKYHYKVMESESKDFPVGMEFLSQGKYHDGRKKVTELSDRHFKSWWFKLLHKCNGHPKTQANSKKELVL